MITKQIVISGIPYSCHVAAKAEISFAAGEISAIVQSWTDEATMLLSASHPQRVSVIALPTIDSLRDPEAALITLPASPLFGGLISANATDLAKAKARAWSRIKTARSAAETAPLTVGARAYDDTDVSQRQIAGAVQLALIAGPAFTVEWTLADNTSATLTQAEVVAVGVALGQRTSVIYAAGRVLRTRIEACTTVAEADAVAWAA